MKKRLSALLVWITAMFSPGLARSAPPKPNGPPTHQTERPGRGVNKPAPQTRRGKHHKVPRRIKKTMLAEGEQPDTGSTEEIA